MDSVMTKQEFERELPTWIDDEEMIEAQKVVHTYIPDNYLCMSTEDAPDWVFKLFSYSEKTKVTELVDGSTLYVITYRKKKIYNWMDMTGQIYFPPEFMQITKED